MKKTALFSAIVAAIALSGCASDSGTASVGPHGSESIGSDNALEGLYLFKVQTDQRTYNITSRGDVRL